MSTNTGFDSGRDFRALVRNSPAEQGGGGAAVRPDPFRSRFGFDAGWVLALARRPGLALRRLAEEMAKLGAAGETLAGRPGPALAPATGPSAKKWIGVFRKTSASIAETSVFGDSGGVPSALARAEAELRARRGAAQPDRGGKEKAAAPEAPDANWAARLAEEYRREFHPRAAPRAEPPAEDQPSVADGAVAAVFGAGRLFWRAGLLLHPLFRFILARSAPILKLAAVGLAILAAAGFFAQWLHSGSEAERVPPPEAAKSAPRRLGWVKIPQPVHLYNLRAPLVAGERLDYEARRHSTGGGREDFLIYGDFDGKAAFVRLAVTRHGSEKMETPSFYVDMARRAAAIGISIDRADPPAPQATRFGEFETAAMSMLKGRLARDNCRGFRSSLAPPSVAIAGFACGADGEPLSGRELACVINRLDLVSAREDKVLRDLFAAAARGGAGCAEPGPPRRGRE